MSDADSNRTRRARWRGIIGLGVHRVRRHALETETRQTLLSLAGVALAVALVLLVSSVSLGLATQSTIGGSSTDYWIVPEGSASSAVTAVEGQKLGQVHTANARIERIDGVTESTPVLVALSRFNISGEKKYVLAVGVIPGAAQGRVAGIPTSGLSAGDPFYADGNYNGTRTGEAVFSEGAATTLDATEGETVTMASGAKSADRKFKVTAIRETEGVGIAQLPVMVVHLSELQVITGAAESDSANQILVASDEDVERKLEGVYPGTDVQTADEQFHQQVMTARLPLAIGGASLIVAVIVGTLFMITTLGLELVADSRNRSLMAVLGVSRWSLALLVATQTLTVATLGGIAGLLLWFIGVLVTNAISTSLGGTTPIAILHPLLPVYGLGVAMVIGLLSVPYLLILNRRTTTIQQVNG